MDSFLKNWIILLCIYLHQVFLESLLCTTHLTSFNIWLETCVRIIEMLDIKICVNCKSFCSINILLRNNLLLL